MSDAAEPVPWRSWRIWLAGVVLLGVGGVFGPYFVSVLLDRFGTASWALPLIVLCTGPAVLLLLTTPSVWLRSQGARTTGHAIWWAVLVLRSVELASGPARLEEAWVPSAAALALLLVPRGPKTGTFQPVAMSRILLVVVIVMIGHAGFVLSRGSLGPGSWLFAGALASGAWGLFKLRGWALLVGLGAELFLIGTVGVALWSGSGVGPELYLIEASALAVVAALTLVLVSVLRGRAPRLPEPAPWLRHLRPIAILTLWAVAVSFAVASGN